MEWNEKKDNRKSRKISAIPRVIELSRNSS
jgi:hypothetical protein